MNANAVWNEALEEASSEDITRFAQLAPKTLSNASAPTLEGESRGKGLLLTRKQIIDLRKYEAAALALPYTLANVKDYLSFGDPAGGGPGLRPEDFLSTFRATRSHARRWSPLRESIMLTGSQLKLFAASMAIYDKAMDEVYEDVRASRELDKHDIRTLEQLKKLELELGHKFPGIELAPDTVEDVGYYLEQIYKKVDDNLKVVKNIKLALDYFGYDLRQHILPDIKLRLGLIGSTLLPVEVDMLKREVDDRALRIEEKNDEYAKAVEKSLGAVAGMNVIGLALAIYLGVEAESIRAERNRLYQEQEAAIEVLRSKHQTLGSLSRVKHDLQGLELVAIDADIATQNLMHVWNVLHLYVKTSQEAVARITDALSLRRFILAFREVALPWKQIERDADALIAVFKEADEEYERVYGIRMRAAFVLAPKNDYPTVDPGIMADSHRLMNDGAVQARMLFIQWNYLPQLHDRFVDLVLNVGKSSQVLGEAALSTRVALEGRARRLQELEKERVRAVDEHDIQEIEADRAAELEQMSRCVTQSTRQLSDQLSVIRDVFDRRLSQGFIDDLEKEQRALEVALKRLEDQRTERQKARSQAGEAIGLLKKGGVEAIGNDLVLTLEQVTKLGIAPPEIQLVMQAIEQLKKTLVQVGEGVRFLDMVRARDQLAGSVQALAVDIDKKTTRLNALKGKVRFIHVIHAIDDERRRYVGEYQGVVEAYRSFARLIEANAYLEEHERSLDLIHQTQRFIAFVNPLSLPSATHG
ncbi:MULTISPECIES: alpha-xenorhabdolysin family binary toxin subunit A [Pseudomonas]|uniref:alpha-xenorhabdolysin family binary toxin subunit A n=1 Tax=Pseudomonas TaxID=286 RepID=UPI001BEA33BF|nr:MULTISPECIES: alpha-xenorhabdolysin family binary toxin subunit A [Pseudomonas]MBT2338677.1 alpha-xenorhabdolysin family binary toxin subunit A [Pseudomonas fluorescens]MCD4531855.1 alpha-xenorhabdolysin family binary toxin subunit A [Pseudomonas sp. C3-2018]